MKTNENKTSILQLIWFPIHTKRSTVALGVKISADAVDCLTRLLVTEINVSHWWQNKLLYSLTHSIFLRNCNKTFDTKFLSPTLKKCSPILSQNAIKTIVAHFISNISYKNQLHILTYVFVGDTEYQYEDCWQAFVLSDCWTDFSPLSPMKIFQNLENCGNE